MSANHLMVSSCIHVYDLYSDRGLLSFAQKMGMSGSRWCAWTMSGSRKIFPHIDHGLLRRHLALKPSHRQILESYLSPRTTQQPQVEIAYSPRSSDNHGRHYCNTIGGQRLPREVRLLLFGHTHAEIDLRGSFYELTRRLGMRFLPHHMPLPPIGELRAALARDPYIHAVEEVSEGTIKKLPLMVINSSVETAYQY